MKDEETVFWLTSLLDDRPPFLLLERLWWRGLLREKPSVGLVRVRPRKKNTRKKILTSFSGLRIRSERWCRI